MFDNGISPNTGIAWTKSDTNDCPADMVGIWVGGAGAVAVMGLDNQVFTLTGAVVSQIIPIKVKRIMSTNTAATNIVVLRAV